MPVFRAGQRLNEAHSYPVYVQSLLTAKGDDMNEKPNKDEERPEARVQRQHPIVPDIERCVAALELLVNKPRLKHASDLLGAKEEA
jgi:hypothetical protein